MKSDPVKTGKKRLLTEDLDRAGVNCKKAVNMVKI